MTMKKFVLFVLGFFMAFFISHVAHATAPTWSPWSPQDPVSSCPAAYASSGISANGWTPFDIAFSYTSTTQNATCTAKCTDASKCAGNTGVVGPYGPVPIASRTATCVPPEVFSNGTCEVPNQCASKAGKPGITNWTVGYSRTPAGDDLNMVGTVNKIPPNRMVCDSGCLVEMTTGEMVWQSQTPTDQGLYRWSLDVVSIPTGASCTVSTSDAPANKATPNPVCPGYVGEINGVKGCYGTASAPVTTVQADRPSSASQPGNPAAGEKPLTGEGSGSTGAGRTPSSGTGGAAGGPASAANNAKGNGTIDKPPSDKEQQACGAPGQPPCRIDESGTPTGGTAFDRAKTDLSNWKDQQKSAIDAAAGIQAPAWTFTFQLPTGCTAVSTPLESFVLDMCPYQSIIHDLMSMVWAAVTTFTILGMVLRTIRES